MRPQTPPPPPKIIILSLLFYRWLLSLGPAAFRRDYAQPALHDFRLCCRAAYQERGTFGVLRLWPGLIGETVPGLLAEYWLEFFGGKRLMLPVVRRSLVATFAAVILFLCACAAYGRIVDPVEPFAAVGRAHPELALTHALIGISGDLTLLVLLLAGLPLLFLALKQAWPGGWREIIRLFSIRRGQALFLLVAALLISLVLLGFLLLTQYFFGPPACTATNGCLSGQAPWQLMLGFSVLLGGFTLGIFALLVLVTSLSLAILRSSFGANMLRLSLAVMVVLALIMASATLATSAWTLRLWVDAPQFAASSAGLGFGQTAWVIAIVVAMAFSTLIVLGALTSGLRASRAPAAGN